MARTIIVALLAVLVIMTGIALSARQDFLVTPDRSVSTATRVELLAFTEIYYDRQMRQVSVRQDAPLLSLLLREQIHGDEAAAAAAAVRSIHGPLIESGQDLRLFLREEPQAPPALDGLVWRCELGAYVALNKTREGTFIARHVRIPLAFEVTQIRGMVGEDLATSAEALGATDHEIEALTSAFAFDLDFQRDIRSRDRFEVVFERLFDQEGRTVSTGRTLFVAITSRRGGEWFFSFQASGEARPSWYNNLGHSAQRSLMRTPVDAARVSSRFGNRADPILGYSATHRGVDFAAPSGTAVMAAGGGIVLQAGVNGNYGNYVRIRHSQQIETAYAHLSSIAIGVRTGAQVRQGQVIGFVGSTGRSTGPHLHYEVLQRGVHTDPMSLHMEAVRTLSADDYEAFRAEVQRIDALRASLWTGQTRVPHEGAFPLVSAINPSASDPSLLYDISTHRLSWDADGAGGQAPAFLSHLNPDVVVN